MDDDELDLDEDELLPDEDDELELEFRRLLLDEDDDDELDDDELALLLLLLDGALELELDGELDGSSGPVVFSPVAQPDSTPTPARARPPDRILKNSRRSWRRVSSGAASGMGSSVI